MVHKHKRNGEQKFNIEICITSGIHTYRNLSEQVARKVSLKRSQNAHASKKKKKRPQTLYLPVYRNHSPWSSSSSYPPESATDWDP